MDVPLHAVDVPDGSRVVFYETRPRRRQNRRSRGKKARSNSALQQWKWEVRKVSDAKENYGHGCKANVEVWKQTFRSGVLAKETKVAISASASPPCYRLRVQVDDRREYLHKIIAYAYHRDKFAGSCKSWKQFKERYEGDHLPDRGLRTAPGWCIAGWVEAVTKVEHARRTRQLAHARAVQKQFAESEALNRAFERLRAKQPKGKSKKLDDLKRAHKTIEKQVATGRAVLLRRGLTWDIADPDWNPYVAVLFVELDNSTRRQALLASCDQKAREQRQRRHK